MESSIPTAKTPVVLTKEYKHEDLIVAELKAAWNVRSDSFNSAVSRLHVELAYKKKIPRGLLFWAQSH